MRSSHIGVREEVYRRTEKKNLSHAKEVAEYCEKVRRKLKPSLIILHGSTAKGTNGKWSDVDLIVIADFDASLIDRVGKLLELNETRAPIEPLGYTPREFDEMFSKLNPLAIEAVENGIPILGENLFNQFKNRLEEMKNKGLKKTKTGWMT